MASTALRKMVRQVLEEFLRDWAQENLNTGFPAVITAYDPAKQVADVQPQIMRRVAQNNDDEQPAYERVGVVPGCPVHFDGSGVFGIVYDLQVGDRVWVSCSQDSLQAFVDADVEAPGSALPRFSINDAVVRPGLRSPSAPRVPAASGTMRIGAEDGPQIILDAVNQVMKFVCVNEIQILGGALIRVRSDGSVEIQDRDVDPVGGAI